MHAVCAVTARNPLSFCPQRSFRERGRFREQATECSPTGTEDAAADTSPAAADCLAKVYLGCSRGCLTTLRSGMPQPGQREGVPRHGKVEERGADSQCRPFVHPPTSILHSCSQSLSLHAAFTYAFPLMACMQYILSICCGAPAIFGPACRCLVGITACMTWNKPQRSIFCLHLKRKPCTGNWL